MCSHRDRRRWHKEDDNDATSSCQARECRGRQFSSPFLDAPTHGYKCLKSLDLIALLPPAPALHLHLNLLCLRLR